MHRDRELRLGTRGSQLALWQANEVAARLAAGGALPCRIVVIKTSGDRLQDAPLSEVGGKRLFVKEIEDALQRGEIDLAVHSSKDMPAALAEGLLVGGVLLRDDPRDAVVLPIGAEGEAQRAKGQGQRAGGEGHRAEGEGQKAQFERIEDVLAALGAAPSIGTGSVRRVAQLAQVFAGATFAPVRGNVETRLRKLDEGQYHALVLAAAGLRRLGFERRVSLAIPPSICVPAPGQGIVAIEIRADDEPVRKAVGGITDTMAGAALTAERALVSALGGGCQTPIGAFASPLDRETIELMAVVAAPDGSASIRASGRAAVREAEALGGRVARELIAQGADRILAECAMGD
ncbi:MAG: hypothetical protein A3H97_19690 [Acidobacteria bacterium RIFCSPLOWO2_02_FULL_65_29]|nr:MAG: hypothetical protein A3H97_19690 [Acidobacteria bacterium RIFCSPLOWO2_02_FULL_65_29]